MSDGAGIYTLSAAKASLLSLHQKSSEFPLLLQDTGQPRERPAGLQVSGGYAFSQVAWASRFALLSAEGKEKCSYNHFLSFSLQPSQQVYSRAMFYPNKILVFPQRKTSVYLV